jgi:integrase
VSFDQHAPAKGTSDNGRPAGATRVLPTEDSARLAAAAESPEEHAVVELLYEHGLRESEVIALDVENIDRTAAPLLRFRRKGGQWKNREIPPNLLGHIAALLDGRTSGPLLVDPKTGRRRNRHQIIDLTRRLARRGGVPNPNGVTPHTLRAAAITELLNSGAPLHEVQAWADHKHADTTRGYWERSHGLQRDAALTAQLSARLAGQE